jgi:hypothetical protein
MYIALVELTRVKISMVTERLRKRLKKDRPTTTISIRIPKDVLDSLKAIAPSRGFNAYQTLLKSYISDGRLIDFTNGRCLVSSRTEARFDVVLGHFTAFCPDVDGGHRRHLYGSETWYAVSKRQSGKRELNACGLR